MTEPTERDREMARDLLIVGYQTFSKNIYAVAAAIATARAEERGRCARIANVEADAEDRGAPAPLVARVIAGKIRSGE